MANKKAASGAGSIRKKVTTKNGKTHVYWEARYTAGFDAGTGRQIQRSISGKTQKEVAQKLKAATAAIDNGTYQAPSKMTVGEWMDIWTAEYLGSVKPRTVCSYKDTVKNHIKPAMGAIKLEALNAHTIQSFYNGLKLSPKSVKNVHGVLHKALQQAVSNGYIRFNPADSCILPRVERKELHPLDETQIAEFMKAIKGHAYENLFLVTLFTGMREGEVLGLTWDCIDLDNGTITINKQLQRQRDTGEYRLVPTKNSKGRCITPAPFVISTLKHTRSRQLQWKLQNADCWDNPMNLVFTNEIGHHLSERTVYISFKKVVKAIGTPETRFHDLRHSFAVVSIRSGDDIKTVQENLGHATAAFTLDVYGHVTEQMKRESANRMEGFIQSVSAG
jgi:integrase